MAIAAAIRRSPCHYRAEVWPEDGEFFLIRVTGHLSGPFACYPARFDLGLRMDAEAICFTALRADYGPRDDSGKHLGITLYPDRLRAVGRTVGGEAATAD